MKRSDSILQQFYMSKLPKAQKGETVLPGYARPIPRSTDVPGKPKPVMQMTMAESLAKKAIAKQPTIRPAYNPTDREVVMEKNRQYAAAAGKRFNPNSGTVSPWFSDNTDQVLRRAQENIVNPMLDIEMGMIGAGLLGKGLQAAGRYAVENTALKNAYKLNPWALKENPEMFLYRARPVGQNPDINMSALFKAQEEKGQPLDWVKRKIIQAAEYPEVNPSIYAREKYYGRWFEKDPNRLDFYMNPDTRNFADNDVIEILRTKLPKSEAAKLNVSQFEDAKILSASPETEFILPKNMVTSAERFPESNWQKLIQEHKTFNTPHWLKGYKRVPKPAPINNYPVQVVGPGRKIQTIREAPYNPEFYYTDEYGVRQMRPINAGPTNAIYDKPLRPEEMPKLYSEMTKEEWIKHYRDQRIRRNNNDVEYLRKNFFKQQGGPIIDPRGQWAHPGKDTIIPSGRITMKGVPYPVYGEDETGYGQMMMPGGEYQFPGQMVYETPMTSMFDKGGEKTPASYFNTEQERQDYRNRLREEGKRALGLVADDTQYLISTPYHQIEAGNNCINGVCGLNVAAGLKYNNPADLDRYISNQRFAKNVQKGKEDYYRADGNFDIGDHIQYVTKKGNPQHSKIIYDVTTDDAGNKLYHVIHNGGSTQFQENVYTEQQLKDMVNGKMGDQFYGGIHVYRPGYNLDKGKLAAQREAMTSPEARAAIRNRASGMQFEQENDPNYTYNIRRDSPYYNDQPEGMQKFIKYANNRQKINELIPKLDKIGLASRANKDSIHDSLLNVFGVLGQENKWDDRIVGGSGGVENLVERIFKPKSWSIGPGQIKFNEINPEMRKEFGIERPRDLYDWDKLLPLMVAMDSSNRTWMERQGKKFSERIVGEKGLTSNEMKMSNARMSPYFWQGPGIKNLRKFIGDEYDESVKGFRIPKRIKDKEREEYISEHIRKYQKVFDEGSYGQNVFNNIDRNLERTSPTFNQERSLLPIVITAKKQKGGPVPIYVDNPNDPRLKAYNDSLRLYNTEAAYLKQFRDSYTPAQKKAFYKAQEANYNIGSNNRINPIGSVISVNRNAPDGNPDYVYSYKKPIQPVVYKQPEQSSIKELPNIQVTSSGFDKKYWYDKNRTPTYEDSLYNYNRSEDFRKLMNTVGKIPQKQFMKNKEEFLRKYDKGVTWNMDPIGYEKHPHGPMMPVYKKPVQPVQYRAPQPVAPTVQKVVPPPVVQQPAPQKKQNVYEGSPVYARPTLRGPFIEHPGNYLMGFRGANGDTTYVKPEDYERFAVPEYGQRYIESLTKKFSSGGQHGGLDRWFAEKWVDVKTGKQCGRQEGEKRGYPACRPSKRISSQTPKTSSEMSPAEKAKFTRTKTSSERIPYNHKRN